MSVAPFFCAQNTDKSSEKRLAFCTQSCRKVPFQQLHFQSVLGRKPQLRPECKVEVRSAEEIL